MIVLSFDPAKNTFGYAVQEITARSCKLFEYGMLQHTVKDLTGQPKVEVREYISTVNGLVREFKADVIIAERFMSRGRFSGNTGEIVGILLGAVCAATPVRDVRLITSAQWKNALNRKMGEKKGLERLYGCCGITHHELDAIFIGRYGSAEYLSVAPFSTFNEKKFLKELE